jgi:hypothetical protein
MIFDTPFSYQGQGSICYEIVCTNNNYTGGTILSLDLVQNNIARNQSYGDGCWGAMLFGAYNAPNLDQFATGLPSSSVAVLMLGYDNESVSGIPLPFDLSGIGAPGCSLFVSPVAFLVHPTSASGTASFSLDTTGAPTDVVVQLQVFAPSPAQNPLGLVFTNGLYASPRVPPTFMRNWHAHIGSPGGTLQTVVGLVTQFLTP